MRILFVSNLYPPYAIGGYEQICFDVAAGLRARGHTVHVLTSGFQLPANAAPEPGVYRWLKVESNWGLPLPANARWIAPNALALSRHNVRALRRVLSALQPEIVMVWNGAKLGDAILAAVERYRRVVYYLQDDWLAQAPLWSRRPPGIARRRRLHNAILYLLGLPLRPIPATRLVFVSQAVQAQYGQRGVPVTGSAIIYNGLIADRWPARSQHILHRSPEEPYRILYAGQIAPAKGVSTLVDAFAQLRAQPGLAQSCLSLLGGLASAEYEAMLRAQIARLAVEDAVTFLGRRPRAEIGPLYAEHDVLAFPSEGEAFSLGLLEALASAIPVVSTLRGGSAEVIRDGQNALAFAAGDAGELARKLAWLLTHPQEAARLGQVASAEIHSNYTLDQQVAAFESYLLARVAGWGKLG